LYFEEGFSLNGTLLVNNALFRHQVRLATVFVDSLNIHLIGRKIHFKHPSNREKNPL